jgi:hypothetical protein
MIENPIDQSLSESLTDQANERLSNILIKIKHVKDKYYKRKFYLPNGFILQLAPCNQAYYGYSCKCGQRYKCHHCQKAQVEYINGDMVFCKKCSKNSKYRDGIKKIEPLELTDEQQDSIQDLLNSGQIDEVALCMIKDSLKLYRVLNIAHITNDDIKTILTRHRYHFVVPKQITVFKLHIDDE